MSNQTENGKTDFYPNARTPIVDVQRELQTKNREIQRLSNEITAHQTELRGLSDALTAQQTQLRELSDALALNTAELSKERAESKHLLEQLASHDQEITRLRGELSKRDHQIAQRHSEMAVLKAEVARLAKEPATRGAALAALRGSLSWKTAGSAQRLASRARDALALAGKAWRAGVAGTVSKVLTRIKLAQQVRLVKGSGLFDRNYYLTNNPGVANAGVDPVVHYLTFGEREGRDPHPLFDSSYYLSHNPDVAGAGINLLVHYLRFGAYEGRDPHAHFDSSFYLERNPDVAEAGVNPLAHYVGPGIAEGRDPSPDFDTSAYLDANPHVACKGLNPLAHYLEAERSPDAIVAAALSTAASDSSRFNLRAALLNELTASGRAALDSSHDAAPLVSVIIPCFNQGHFLEDAVVSALLACSAPMEIVVVDDGSTDASTVALIDRLADQYKLKVVRQKNMGLAGARNVAIDQARGNFVQFLDADDLLAPEKIDLQLGEFRGDPEVAVCVSEYELCDAEGLDRRVERPSTIAGFSFSQQEFLLRWERGFWIPLHCALFRRQLLKQTRFRMGTKAGREEWIFWVDLAARKAKFKFIPAVLATYRIHSNNLVKNGETLALDFVMACIYLSQLGLDKGCEEFAGASVEHFRTVYLDSIKHEATLSWRTYPAE